ncbi:hypothetical protein GUJ93_ZPchr0007g6154 [Zizania palustris]|uniref:Uncharacterized protein n=1 Tax=Zizania palustris TaxID=103762 RepID=A0A8J5TJP5_ZIZPA|nr:hypothetical protein GUJ93_ZPchr0007g6154 [Zizania palustris]
MLTPVPPPVPSLRRRRPSPPPYLSQVRQVNHLSAAAMRECFELFGRGKAKGGLAPTRRGGAPSAASAAAGEAEREEVNRREERELDDDNSGR